MQHAERISQQVLADPASGAVERLRRMVERVAASDISVLILGETGVGKERLAEEVHHRSRRARRPLLRLNCAALGDSLLESELFGHERGAFTGAHERKLGLLEAAQGGTVFLDELGDMPLFTQVKLLRVLEERRVRRLGATASFEIDVRFLSATNRDVAHAVRSGAFREDLYFRLNGLTLLVPPLRERRGEIEPLAREFLAEACARQGRAVPQMTPDALRLLVDHPWPGNVRELRSAIERALVLCEGDVLSAAHLPEQAKWTIGPTSLREGAPAPSLSPEELRRSEQLAALLREHRGNVTAVARSLGKARFQVQRWLKRYRIDSSQFR